MYHVAATLWLPPEDFFFTSQSILPCSTEPLLYRYGDVSPSPTNRGFYLSIRCRISDPKDHSNIGQIVQGYTWRQDCPLTVVVETCITTLEEQRVTSCPCRFQRSEGSRRRHIETVLQCLLSGDGVQRTRTYRDAPGHSL